MSIGKSVFDVIEHCSTEVVLPTPIDQGRQKRQYFHFSTRSSGEKLTIFVNLYDNTDRTTMSNSLAWSTIESDTLT